MTTATTKPTMAVSVATLPLAAPFRITGYVFHHAEVITVTLDDGVHRGRGEAAGVFYLGDDTAQMVSAIERVRPQVEAGASRHDLLTLMPSGGGRNAVDAALWDIEAARARRPVWQLAELPSPKPLVTTFTVGADTPAAMAAGARAYAHAVSLKLKLTGELDLDIARVDAVRSARPDVWLGVDGNQGYAFDQLDALAAALRKANVLLLEQPIARGQEHVLDHYRSLIPLAADESVLDCSEIGRAAGRFDVINIKLDKCGGLTEALRLARAAREQGFGVMVGNMISSSIAMAPAFLLGQVCDLVDLDGAIFLAQDCIPGATYDAGRIWCSPEVWGGGA